MIQNGGASLDRATRSQLHRIEETFRTVVLPVFGERGSRVREYVSGALPEIRFRLSIDGLAARAEQGERIVDIGAGLSPLGPVLQALGAKVALVDDFGGGGGILPGMKEEARQVLERCAKLLGVEVYEQDVLTMALPFADASVDVVTSFHCFEHFHRSPRFLMSEIRRIMRPGASFILCTPNAVNLRKRISVVVGRTNWPTLEEWYYEGEPVFRGHVREPTVSDLLRLCVWNGLLPQQVMGANVIGKEGAVMKRMPKALVSVLSLIMDRVLPYWPNLCSDILVVASKPTRSAEHGHRKNTSAQHLLMSS